VRRRTLPLVARVGRRFDGLLLTLTLSSEEERELQ